MKKSELAKDILFNAFTKVFAIFFFNLRYISVALTILLTYLAIIDLDLRSV